MSRCDVVVVGAGIVGQAAAATLETLGSRIRVIRRGEPLDFAEARVVLCAAGPLRDVADEILVAALAAGANYVDVGGEQPVLRALHERHDAAARKAGLVALPGAGVDCLIGDLAAHWAARALHDLPDEEVVRARPPDRLDDGDPLDEVWTAYVYDHLALSAGSQRALFGSVGESALQWRAERWEPVRAGSIRSVNVPELGGERDAIAFGAGDCITVPRHLDARIVATYRSIVRSAVATRALGLFARAIPFLPKKAGDVLAAYPIGPEECAKTKFAIATTVRRGFDQAHATILGSDAHRTTGAIAAWCAHALAHRDHGPVGMRAPSEVFGADAALREIAVLAKLTIESSW